jgi:hypothetical protein
MPHNDATDTLPLAPTHGVSVLHRIRFCALQHETDGAAKELRLNRALEEIEKCAGWLHVVAYRLEVSWCMFMVESGVGAVRLARADWPQRC